MTQEFSAGEELVTVIRPRETIDGLAILRTPSQGPDPQDTNSTANRLFAILSWKRPYDSATEELFAKHYLDPIKGMTKDDFSNRHMHIPYPDGERCKIMWSCHIDTCHNDEGYQRLIMSKDKDGIAYIQTQKGEGNCLGADDGTGVFLMLEMIRAGKPGYYLFHRGEEKGCIGSRWLKDNRKTFLEGFDAAIALDRRDFDNIITHQGGERGCSEEFAKAIGKQIGGYKPDPTGAYTDTKQYFALIPECTNLSVGYQGQHGPGEKQYIGHALTLRKSLIAMDLKALPIVRDRTKIETRYGGQGYGYSYTPRPGVGNFRNYMEDPDAITHQAHADFDNKVWCWSVKESAHIRRLNATWVKWTGYVSNDQLDRLLPWQRRNAGLPEDGPVNKPMLMIMGMPPTVRTPGHNGGPEMDVPESEEDEEWLAMVADNDASLIDLVKKYPVHVAKLLEENKIGNYDICSDVYGGNEWLNFVIELDEIDALADASAGIDVAPGEDAEEIDTTPVSKEEEAIKAAIIANLDKDEA